MKVCKECGAVQQDERIFCIDCGEKLDDPISKTEESKIAKEISNSIDVQYDKSDPFAVDLPMKIVAALNIIAAIFSLVMFIISDRPEKSVVLISFIWYAFSFTDALFPEIIWTLTKFRDFFRYDNFDDLEPSFIYCKIRRIGVWVGLIFGIAITAAYLIL